MINVCRGLYHLGEMTEISKFEVNVSMIHEIELFTPTMNVIVDEWEVEQTHLFRVLRLFCIYTFF